MADKIEMLTQPLLTEEGFLNPACVNELEQAIRNIPPIHQRVKDDLEWTQKRWTFRREITAAFAYNAVRQYEQGRVPPNLEKLTGFLDASLETSFDWRPDGLVEISLVDIAAKLHEILMPVPEFLEWNKGEKFIDLDALIANVCILIRTDRREFDRFNKEFEERYEREHGKKPFTE